MRPTRSLRRTAAGLAALVGLLGAACGLPATQSPADIAADFDQHRSQYEEINSLILEDVADAAGPGCRAIGLRRVGDYWRTQGEWSRSGTGEPVSLLHVLTAARLEPDRYDRYVTALEEAEASLAQRCPAGDRTEITVATSGLGVSGCITNVEIRNDRSIPDPQPSDVSSEVIPLADGWYVNHTCT